MPDQDALVWRGGRTVAVVPVPVPEARPGWVPVDVAYAGICGTDLHIAAGEQFDLLLGSNQRQNLRFRQGRIGLERQP